MEKIISKIFWTICLSMSLCLQLVKGQDSIVISLRPANLDAWYYEDITFNKEEIYFLKYWDGLSKRVLIRLNRYKEFHQFLLSSFSSKEIARLDEVYRTNLATKEANCEALYEVKFSIYENGEREIYVITIFEKSCEVEGTDIPELNRILLFWKDFFREHGCSKAYNIHSVVSGESYESICKKYQMDELVVIIYNSFYEDVFRALNQRDLDLKAIWEHKQALHPKDKLLIPCLPEKVSKYE
ncbi:hypothetical protein SapgrDRAFT_3551 [Saprospira grandis DSM 2844]|uniref:LysM domain-containing protein n=1 Tax=Saprospira grandis DSM 2844 TaxID=694433 RepID=J0P5P0_9BACT|nr:hypothetical protein [Saprospira grandis]EJF55184.1 hypothetical protein SapgrDRAFT_3551 [Saprospira grandis DSM 2844]